MENEIIEDATNIDFDMLDEEDGDGSYCCGKRMVLAPSGIVYECLKCGSWEYSSS